MKRILEAIQARRRRRVRLGVGVGALCVAALLAVGLGLMHPAITMGREPECGCSEHTHTEDCLESLTINQPLICGLEEHVHADLCYDAAGELTCQLPEHTHDEPCYGEAQTVSTLVCQLPEHIHTESCYPETPEYTLAPEPRCGLAEHTHEEACGENCTIPEHTHTEACFTIPAEAPEEEEEIPEELPEDGPQEDEPQEDEPQEDGPQEDEPQEDEPQEDEPQEDEPQEDGQAPEETDTLDGDMVEAQFFLRLHNAPIPREETETHKSILFTPHFCMTGTIREISGYTTDMDSVLVSPPGEAEWKTVVRANYTGLTEEQINHLRVVWVAAAPKPANEAGNGAYKDCKAHVDGRLEWEPGYEGPDLTQACGITLTAAMWWEMKEPDNATCVLLRKNEAGDYVEYDRKTFSKDSHTGQYDFIWTGLPGEEADYAMRVDGLDPALWRIEYAAPNQGGGYNFSDSRSYATPFMYADDTWGQYGYKLLAWAHFRENASTGRLRLQKQTLLNGQSSPDTTPPETLFTIKSVEGSYQNTVKYRDFQTDEAGNRYLLLEYLQPGQYTVTESGGNQPGYVLSVTENVTASVEANGEATAAVTNTYTTGALLPSTGGTGLSAIYTLAVTLSAPAALGLLWRKRKREN